MKEINLREFYQWYMEDVMVEVTDVPLVKDDIWAYLDAVATKAKSMSGGLSPANILDVDKSGIDSFVYGNKMHVHGMIAAVEGMVLNGVTLSKVDVSAIAG